jgi:PAS domain S-box-containing protein
MSSRDVLIEPEHEASIGSRVEHAVAQALAETTDVAAVYPTLLATIGRTLGLCLGAAWEETHDGDALRCVAVWEAAPNIAGDFRELTQRMTLGPGEGLPGRVWQSGRPAWIPEVPEDANFPRAVAASAAGLRAAFSFPLTIEGRVVGAIEFFAREHRDPDDELLASIAVLGSQVGQLVARRRAEDAARAGEALNRAILDSALDAVVTMDHRGRILEFNPAAERIFGYSREQAIGQDMATLIVPPALRDAHRRGLERYLATEEPVLLEHRLEITGMRADGSELPVELAITRVRLEGPPTFAGFLRDITERKRADAELQASRARLVETADSERRRIERNLHDGAQQRLVALALRLRMARTSVGDTHELSAALADVEREIELALEELRELARGIHPAVLATRGLATAVASLTERAAIQVDILELPPRRLPEAVEAAAYYVVAEALTNAAKHAVAQRVQIELRDSGDALEVVITDDGKGGASLDGGTGLRGLADRVEAAGGRLQVLSPVGEGTLLRAELPLS